MPKNLGNSDELIFKMHKGGYSYKKIIPAAGLSDRANRNILYKHGIQVLLKITAILLPQSNEKR